jgi:hypothetical protein
MGRGCGAVKGGVPVNQYYSVRRPEEFRQALDKASADGTLKDWTYSQLLGVVAPPGTDERERTHGVQPE